MKQTTAFLLCTFFIIGLNSCIENTGINASIQAEQIKATTSISAGNHTGIFVAGKGVFTCPNGALLQINEVLSEKILAKISNSYSGNHVKGTSLFVEVETAFSEKTNSIEISSIDSISSLNAFNMCVPYDYWCSGTEPFWDFVISKKLGLAQCYDFGLLSLDCQYTEPIILPDGTTQYFFPIKGKAENVEVLIRKESCSDGMSEREFSHIVEVRSPDKVFQGCADIFGSAKKE